MYVVSRFALTVASVVAGAHNLAFSEETVAGGIKPTQLHAPERFVPTAGKQTLDSVLCNAVLMKHLQGGASTTPACTQTRRPRRNCRNTSRLSPGCRRVSPYPRGSMPITPSSYMRSLSVIHYRA